MGNFLPSPIVDKESDRFISSTGLECAGTGMQGWRLEMEDEHILTDMTSLPDHTFLAVFDGHGGAGSAKYAKKHLVNVIENTKKWSEYKETRDIKLLGDALMQAFVDIDENLRVHQQPSQGSDISGCTAVTAMITPNYILCANSGDSRCILATNNSVVHLSVDHKPYNPIEKTRIENAKGSVRYDRVDGELAVSRGLGDFQYKSTDLHPSDQKVTCYPDIMVHERTSKDEILLLACDGVWDVYSNEDVAYLLYELLDSGEKDMVMIAEEVVDMAFEKGSQDNISVVAVKLPGARNGSADGGGVARRRQERNMNRHQLASSPVGRDNADNDPDDY